ncbi:hypothetical protein APS56_15585 [Pseudalgibacter alginicilyticus]|uniref:RNA polymerase sigma-70 region 2 domain-containing protein n=1 Tax=Pseudalgibacter alginicilyticus TaxID=1736674 RepID=A0A0P0D6B6_9FLAO|nr:sigma-70 family RNA polymerase sigma factor [Pseudalgibacter alginicilyticus]ALJ06467.1 hypothetical protein APS56_15585 [Pseudalgibacter alginicilyticus]
MFHSDKDLLVAIYDKKDEKAFKIFYNRYANLLLHWGMKHTGNKDIASDIAQNFWVIFWSKPYAIKTDKEDNARKYLIHYFTYRMFDYLRSSAAKSFGNEYILETLSKSESYSHIIENIQVDEILEVIDNLLKVFPELTQQIFKEVWENNSSVKAVSQKLGVSEKVVRTHHKKVITLVRNKIQDLLNDTTDLKSQKTIIKIIILIGLIS